MDAEGSADAERLVVEVVDSVMVDSAVVVGVA